jgi:hypothetical protein
MVSAFLRLSKNGKVNAKDKMAYKHGIANKKLFVPV